MPLFLKLALGHKWPVMTGHFILVTDRSVSAISFLIKYQIQISFVHKTDKVSNLERTVKSRRTQNGICPLIAPTINTLVWDQRHEICKKKIEKKGPIMTMTSRWPELTRPEMAMTIKRPFKCSGPTKYDQLPTLTFFLQFFNFGILMSLELMISFK